MKSLLGLVLAAIYAAAFGFAFHVATQPGADFMAGQWLYFFALPYTISTLSLFGTVDLSSGVVGSVLKAAGFCCALAYLAGAIFEKALRLTFALVLRFKRRA